MRKHIYIILLGSLLSACVHRQAPLTFESTVKITKVEALNSYKKYFTGTVASTNSVNLAFAIGGLIDAMYVSEGEYVSKDKLLASLDTKDYQLQVNSTQASYNTAKSILDRARRLQQRNAISNQELEMAEDGYMQARTNYMYALNRLSDTELTAPFAGSIERQYVDTYQEVNAGTLIYRLMNPNSLEIKFTLPEGDANMLLVPLDFYVEFDNLSGRRFSAEMKNYIDGSVASAGIPITLGITDPKFSPSKLNIKVGFSCKVIIQLSDNKDFASYTTIPISALINSNKVWIYNSSSSSVSERNIVSDGLTGQDQVIISKGLKQGENVVTAGVYSLVEGQKVRVLK